MGVSRGLKLEFCNGGGAQKKLEWCSYENIKKCCSMSIRLDTIPIVDGLMDSHMGRRGKTILCSACCACWHLINSQSIMESSNRLPCPVWSAARVGPRIDPLPSLCSRSGLSNRAPCSTSTSLCQWCTYLQLLTFVNSCRLTDVNVHCVKSHVKQWWMILFLVT